MRSWPGQLPSRASAELKSWQAALDRVRAYPDRVAAGKLQFKAKNVARNATFKAVRATLRTMCRGAVRCMYCESSTADEVEHIWPKDLFPGRVFVWSNYLYACGGCNGTKLAQWSIFRRNGAVVDVSRGALQAVVGVPERGSPLFIDPRAEDGWDFFALDLLDTFRMLPKPSLSARDKDRARYTLRVLGFDDREDLLLARRAHFGSYRARLYEYLDKRDVQKLPGPALKRLIVGLQRMDHPFVWHEMKRQRARLPELAELFGRAPEALRW